MLYKEVVLEHTLFSVFHRAIRLVKNLRTSEENSVYVSVKKPVESTVENRLIELCRYKKIERKARTL